ncbi:hypothetical protein ALP48_05436 [Pseudomonas syringae pv. solidagae]|uniref:Uncharacterized protein n=1 Tax=Pseudomonas syringae pv. solidagae TaxID=264458 RepID=A0A3M5KW99_PSESX|nr:hypothetical protein ALP48_05436 [Pseudomonas syringae pv. solidagae]
MQAAEKLVHVTGLTGKLGNLEQRILQMLGALAIPDFLTQCIVGCRKLLRAQGHHLLQVSAVQLPVQCHGHMARYHGEQRTILGTVDTRYVINLHRDHAKDVVRCIFQGRAHPELGQTSDAVEPVFGLGQFDAGGIEKQRLPAAQHISGKRHPVSVDKLERFMCHRFVIEAVNVIRVSDLAALPVIQRNVEVLGIDQGPELLMNALQKSAAVQRSTGQQADFVQNALSVLRADQCRGLQQRAQPDSQIQQQGVVFFSHRCQHPPQHALALPRDPAMQLQLSAIRLEIFSSDMCRPDNAFVALPEQAFQFTSGVCSPGNGSCLLPCGADQCFDGGVTGESVAGGWQRAAGSN